MKRWLVVALAAVAMALVPTAVAAEEGQHGDGNRAVFGPYSSDSTDSGTCGKTNWAFDTFKRVFYVQQTGPTTWHVAEAFIDGHFTTLESDSPGACETSSPHGRLIVQGKTGRFGGFFDGNITSGTYNPAGCAVPKACDTTTKFIQVVFGQLRDAYNVTTFYFDYRAHDQGLIYTHWINASANLRGNHGDIASS